MILNQLPKNWLSSQESSKSSQEEVPTYVPHVLPQEDLGKLKQLTPRSVSVINARNQVTTLLIVLDEKKRLS